MWMPACAGERPLRTQADERWCGTVRTTADIYWLEQLFERVRTDVTRSRVSLPAVVEAPPVLRLAPVAPVLLPPPAPALLPPVAAPPPVPLVPAALPAAPRSVVEPLPSADAIIVPVT